MNPCNIFKYCKEEVFRSYCFSFKKLAHILFVCFFVTATLEHNNKTRELTSNYIVVLLCIIFFSFISAYQIRVLRVTKFSYKIYDLFPKSLVFTFILYNYIRTVRSWTFISQIIPGLRIRSIHIIRFNVLWLRMVRSN